MLTRVRIEVEGEESASAAEEALNKYEIAIQLKEAGRYELCHGGQSLDWDANPSRGFPRELGREITDEVIEYDPSYPGYKGRRVVQYRRVDTLD